MKRSTTALLALAIPLAIAACSSPGGRAIPGPALGSTLAAPALAAGTRAKVIYFAGYYALNSETYGEIGTFPATATGNVAPGRLIRGSSANLTSPEMSVLDSTGRLWECDFNRNNVQAYASGAHGNVAPIVQIAGTNVPLDACQSMALGPDGSIYATSFGAHGQSGTAIMKWPPGTNGNVAPSKLWNGPNTGLYTASGIALDKKGNVWVTSAYSGPSISMFGPTAGNVAPLRKIAGPATKLANPFGLAIDPLTQHLIAANEKTSTITFYDANASGNAAPLMTLGGPNTKIFNPYGVTMDGAGYLYVGNCPQGDGTMANVGSIEVFAPGAHGNVAPLQIIVGAKTTLACVNGLSVR